MAKHPLTLRTVLASVTVLLTTLAVLAAGALVVLTSLLHQTTVTLGDSLETVRLVEEAEIDLLLHGRAGDGLLRRDIEGDLRRQLRVAGNFVDGKDEQLVLDQAKLHVNAYLAAARAPDSSSQELLQQAEKAFQALDNLVEITVAQARQAQRQAARIDSAANILGISAGALLVVVAVLLLVWLRASTFRPIFQLADVMQRIGKGDRSARADDAGPAELRNMAQRFNEMAGAISGQRDAQAVFLAGVAHDLRNPLSALQMSIAALRPDEPLPSEARLRRVFSVVQRQIWHLDRMIGDFLDMAKIEAGQLELRLEQCDARKLVQEVVDLFEASSPAHELELSLPPNSLLVNCDSLRIEQVISNLVSNAIKYSPGGGKVMIRLEPSPEEVIITVVDRGVGISRSDQAHLFEPFRRVGLSRKLVPGVGLGLFVVRRIVEAHHGRITLESSPGKGSTFHVYLPVSHAQGSGPRRDRSANSSSESSNNPAAAAPHRRRPTPWQRDPRAR